ncbi:MAG: hypothetical protein HOW97_42270, partial [Catenulispora sp.]|nr:hypothetical protein [Catenulispora sp.]
IRAASALELLPALVAGVLGGVAATAALARLAGPALGRPVVPVRFWDLAAPVLACVLTFAVGQAAGIIRGSTQKDLSAALRIGA